MKCELPEFARCCFCFPLRFGLVVWAITKLVLIVLLFLNLSIFIVTETIYRRSSIRQDLPLYIITIIMVLFLSVDIVFHIICIISAYTKNHRKMNLFYKEALFGLGMYIFGFFYLVVIFMMQFSFFGLYMGLEIWCVISLFIFVQIYLIILVRSEMRKTEKNMNFEFTNHIIENRVITNDVA